MKKIFISLFALNILFNMLSWYFLPDQVAIHFGAHGLGDSWGSKDSSTLLFMLMDGVMFVMIYFVPALAFVMNGALLSIPNKPYWTQPEHKEDLRATLTRTMNEFGSALMLFLLAMGVLTFLANQIQPARLNVSVFVGLLVLFMLYTIYWMIQFYKTLRVPSS